jgi:glycosyltransferase involved in cell wall biosynthesis
MKALMAERPDVMYLLIGTRSANYDAAAHIDMLGLTDRVRLTGYVPPAALARYIAASDLCVNLRFPTAGETSASALRAMAAGVPVIVSRTGAFDELPDGAVARVDVGAVESELLLEYLRLLIARGDVRAVMGAAGRSYVSTHHAPDVAASRYLAFITSLRSTTPPVFRCAGTL